MQRSLGERFFQAVIYELFALVLFTPIYSFALNLPLGNSFKTLMMISVAVVIWVWIYNTIFDRILYAQLGLLAHEKTPRLRLFHAVLYEVTITFIAVPIIFLMSGKPAWVALTVDIIFSFFFAAYTYVFYLTYDRLRPVKPTKS